MKFLGWEFRRADTNRPLYSQPVIETGAVSGGLNSNGIIVLSPTARVQHYDANRALTVPAVLAAVTFLSRTLATLDLDVFRDTKEGPVSVGGKLGTIIRDAPNPEWSGFAARNYFWQSVFTQGRGLQIIIRDDRDQPVELWSVNPDNFRIRIDSLGRKTYIENISNRVFDARDVIDVPFFLCSDQVTAHSPLILGESAIRLALAMAEYGRTFFGSGGLPPMAVESPTPTSAETTHRAMDEINRVIEDAKAKNSSLFPMPPGYKINALGFDPKKGEMTDGRRFQIEEIARVFQLPPVFLQDLTHATLNNSESQDLFLVKHLLSQWATAYEKECNLKLFGQLNGRRYIRHQFDSLLRGDFMTRMEGLVSSVQGGIRTPNEARRVEGLPAHPDAAADQLFMQGATVPIDDAQAIANNNSTENDLKDDTSNDD